MHCMRALTPTCMQARTHMLTCTPLLPCRSQAVATSSDCSQPSLQLALPMRVPPEANGTRYLQRMAAALDVWAATSTLEDTTTSGSAPESTPLHFCRPALATLGEADTSTVRRRPGVRSLAAPG